MEIHFAPIQGHTDAAYRNIHSRLFKGVDFYYTPFIRWETTGIRPRDIRDLSDEMNPDCKPVPQIIFKDHYELYSLVSVLYGNGIRRIDLNLGCPFPLQTARGRGAALISDAEMAREIVKLTEEFYDVDFSIKMRLGFKDPDDWKASLPILNNAKLRHITLHPRYAAQQYGGSPDMQRFSEFIEECKIPLIYNGDITTPDKFNVIRTQFPNLKGIMIGRGMIGRPTLGEECVEGNAYSGDDRIQKLIRFHRTLLTHYKDTLCGDIQVLNKIKPFWEYSQEEIGRKPWKAIKKASNMAKYQTAVASIIEKN